MADVEPPADGDDDAPADRPPQAETWFSGPPAGEVPEHDAEDDEDGDPAPVTPLRGLDGVPFRRSTGLRPVPPAHVRRPGRALSPVAETWEGAEVRPLRPAPPAESPALAALPDPDAAPVPIEPLAPSDAVIDAEDPLGLGRSPLAPREPAPPVTDAWLADWISGNWAMPDGPAPGSGPEEPSRLGDEDRALLAHQSGSADPPRPRMTRRAGIGGPPGARGPRPPDIAG